MSRIEKNVVTPKPSVLRIPTAVRRQRELKGLSLDSIMIRMVLPVVGCWCFMFKLLS